MDLYNAAVFKNVFDNSAGNQSKTKNDTKNIVMRYELIKSAYDYLLKIVDSSKLDNKTILDANSQNNYCEITFFENGKTRVFRVIDEFRGGSEYSIYELVVYKLKTQL